MKIRKKIKQFFNRPVVARSIIITSILLIVVDMVYSNIAGINQVNRETMCIVYTSMPRWLFLIYEYFFETLIVVLLGIFASTLIEQYIRKIKRFFPKNQLMAFIYGAILPICSCGAVPLIETMKERVSLRVIITFVIAAPLLNPYIIALSISVMGVKYCIIRIMSSFVLAMLTGLLVDFAARYLGNSKLGKFELCEASCTSYHRDPFVKAINITQKLLPYILLAGLISVGLEFFNPKQYLSELSFNNQWVSLIVMALIGIPVYVCNGADILLLKPMLSFTDLSLGSAMVFSLTSSAVCMSSIVMLSKFLGTKLTWILVGVVFILSILIGLAINTIC